MSAQTLYEYTVLFIDPKDKSKSKVVVEPKRELCTSESHARTLASRAIPEEWMDRVDELEIKVIAPFR